MKNILAIILILIFASNSLKAQSKFEKYIYLSGFQRINIHDEFTNGAISENYSYGIDGGVNFVVPITTIQYGIGIGLNYINQAQHVIGQGRIFTFTGQRISDTSRTHILNNINLQINFLFKTLLFQGNKKIKLVVLPEIQIGVLDNSKLASVTTYFQENNRIEKTYIKDSSIIGFMGSVGIEYPIKSFDLGLMLTYAKRKSNLLESYVGATFIRLRMLYKL